MRAKSVNFERGVDPKDALGLGDLGQQKEVFDKLLNRLEEVGIESTFYDGFYDEKNSESQIGASLKIPTGQPNRLYYTVYREKNDRGWEYVVYYNLSSGWQNKNDIVFNSSDADKVFYFLLQKAEEGFMGEIKKVNKMIKTYRKKKAGLQDKIHTIQKYNEM